MLGIYTIVIVFHHKYKFPCILNEYKHVFGNQNMISCVYKSADHWTASDAPDSAQPMVLFWFGQLGLSLSLYNYNIISSWLDAKEIAILTPYFGGNRGTNKTTTKPMSFQYYRTKAQRAIIISIYNNNGHINRNNVTYYFQCSNIEKTLTIDMVERQYLADQRGYS